MSSIVEIYKASLGTASQRGLIRKSERGDRVLIPSGAKYSHVLSHGARQGMSSVFDQDIVTLNAGRQADITGKNVRKIKITEGGQGTYNHNGRIFVSDPDGVITLANGSYLAREKQMRDEQEKYISEVIEYLIYDDDLAMDTLGITKDQYDADFGPKKETDIGAKTTHGVPIPGSLLIYDARANGIDAAPPGSKWHTGGMSKLRWLVKNGGYSVIIDQGMAPVYEKDNI